MWKAALCSARSITSRALRSDETTRMKIKSDMVEALKQKDTMHASVLRQVYAEIIKADKVPRTSDRAIDDTAVIKKCAKRWQEAITEYRRLMESCSADQEIKIRAALDKETSELRIIEQYLPPQFSEEELKHYVQNAIADPSRKTPDSNHLGIVMKQLVLQLDPGRYDKKDLSALVAKMLGR